MGRLAAERRSRRVVWTFARLAVGTPVGERGRTHTERELRPWKPRAAVVRTGVRARLSRGGPRSRIRRPGIFPMGSRRLRRFARSKRRIRAGFAGRRLVSQRLVAARR